MEAATDRHTIGGVDEAHVGVGAGADEARAPGYGHVLQGVFAIVTPATLLTAIAFYFGWTRVRAFDLYFGLNPAAVSYSTRDYVLDSLDPLFLPVIVVLFGLMALAVGHAYVGRLHRFGKKPEKLRRLSVIGLIGGLLLLLVGGLGAFGAFPFHTPYLISTLFPAGGVLLIADAVDLRTRLRGDPPLGVGGRVFVALFVGVCLFWAAGLYAGTVGRDEAASLARDLNELPGVSITSTSDLGIPGGGRRGAGSYSYSNLRLLTVANGTLFLLPANWRPSFGQLYTVSESALTQLSFRPGTLPSSRSAFVNGLSPIHLPATDTTAGPVTRTRKLGQLVIHVVHTPGTGSAVVRFVSKSKHVIVGASLAARLGKRARPLVFGTAAVCRVKGVRFTCPVRAILPKQTLSLRISYRGPASTHGKLEFRLAGHRQVLPLSLSR